MDDPLSLLEAEVDREYLSCFPSEHGWEAAALHALLEYDRSVGHDEGQESHDALKFALMHLFRWGVDSAPRPLPGIPHRADPLLLSKVQSALRHAANYVGVWFAFISAREGISAVEELSPQAMSLSVNPRWFAYDALDLRLHGDDELDPTAAPGSLELMNSLVNKIGDYEPSQGPSLLGRRLTVTAEEAADFWSATHQNSAILPDVFELDGISIADLRRFWTALNMMSSGYLLGNLRRPPPEGSFARLMCGTRTEWMIRTRSLSGLSSEVTSRLLDMHTMKQARDSDPGVTPLLPIGTGWLVASPALLCTAYHERNFCAYAARFHRAAFDRASGILAREATRELAEFCEGLGLRAAIGTPLSTPAGNTDVDLAVYDSKAHFLLLMEHKHILKTADFKEVLNRGQATCVRAQDKQLPKLSWCAGQPAEEFARRAFGDPSLRVARASALLCTRGFVGTQLLERYAAPTLDESLLRRWLVEGSRLQEVFRRASTREYLPMLNVDYRLEDREIVTPGRRRIVVQDWSPCH